MGKPKIRVVIDTNVFIPCGDKSEDKIKSIKLFGEIFPKVAETYDITILLSTEILDEYKMIRAKVKDCHPLPKFHANFIRNLERIRRLHRLKKCREITVDPFNFHVIESSKIDRYDVRDFVENDPDDEKFLRVALVEASKGVVLILSVDDESLLKLRDTELYERLCRKFDEAKNVKVLLPHELIEILENQP